MQTLLNFFGIQNLMPHGYCLNWNPVLLWLHVASDILITLSYYSIPLSLIYFIRKRKDLPYAWLIIMGAIFILACGTTHLMSAVLIWIPLYWLDGYLKVFTAIISVATALAMLHIIPIALKLPSAEQLQFEINERKYAELVAQEAAERLHKIANQLPKSVVFQFQMRTDGSFCIPYASEVLREVYRVKPEEVRNDASPIFAHVHPDDLARHIENIKKSARELSQWNDEYRLKFEDGTEYWLSGNAQPQRQQDGSTVWHGFVADISERKQIELNLKASEARFRSIIDISPVPIALNDNQQNITFLNNAFINTFGYNLEDIPTLQKWWEKAYPDENYRQWVLDTWETTLKQCEDVDNTIFPQLEFTIVCKAGTQKTVLISAAGICDSFDLHLVSLYDITERKCAEMERERLFKIIEESPDFIGVSDMDANLKYLNIAAIKMVGLPADTNILKLKIDDMHPQWAAKLVLEEGIPAILQEGLWRSENALLHKTGFEIPVSQILTVHRDTSNKPQFISTIMRDVTERKKMEHELLRSNAELEQFAYAVSHDMRQPLRMVTSYLGLIETALQSKLDEETQQFLNFAVDGAKRMDAMILSLLEYSRIGKQTEVLSLISTREAVDEALLFLKPALEMSGGEVEVLGEWIDLVASRDELTRLLQNLIGNALKYHEENKPPVVKICATIRTNIFRVEIQDSGIGIAPHQIDRLFKFFSRLQARSRFEGTGVGLALCRKIVEHHGGTIGVISEGEGQGCIFWFELPIDSFNVRTQREI